MIFPNTAPTTTTTKTVTPAPRVVMTNEEVDAYMASEMLSQFGGMYISNKPDTQIISLATTVKSEEENDSSVTKVENKQEAEDLTSSRQVATSESIAASLAIIAKGDQFEDDMMTTGADLFGVTDDGNASSNDDDSDQTTKKSESITATAVVPSKRNQQYESSMIEITRGVDHLTIICNAMEEDQDEMEVDLLMPEPQEEHDDVWMTEPWEIMEVDDPDEKDIDWMELL